METMQVEEAKPLVSIMRTSSQKMRNLERKKLTKLAIRYKEAKKDIEYRRIHEKKTQDMNYKIQEGKKGTLSINNQGE